jgi:hypothetical protein
MKTPAVLKPETEQGRDINKKFDYVTVGSLIGSFTAFILTVLYILFDYASKNFFQP